MFGRKTGLKIYVKVNINQSQNNRDLKQSILHLWSKFVDPRLTLKRLGHFFQNVILISNVVQH